ncbi:hypothetical protein VCPCS022_001910A, partial [Vibrio cholerae O1 str. PCS-022]
MPYHRVAFAFATAQDYGFRGDVRDVQFLNS